MQKAVAGIAIRGMLAGHQAAMQKVVAGMDTRSMLAGYRSTVEVAARAVSTSALANGHQTAAQEAALRAVESPKLAGVGGRLEPSGRSPKLWELDEDAGTDGRTSEPPTVTCWIIGRSRPIRRRQEILEEPFQGLAIQRLGEMFTWEP